MDIRPKASWVLASCLRYCSSCSFLCLLLTISFHSTKTVLLEHVYSCFLCCLLFQLKLLCSMICSMWTQLLSTAVETPGRAVPAGTLIMPWLFAVMLSAAVARQAQLAAGCGSAFCTCHLLLELSGCSRFPFKNRKEKWSGTPFCKCGSPYKMW